MKKMIGKEKVFFEFKKLKEAIVDASSIIYMKKAGFFDELEDYLQLYSLKEIIEETGFNDLKVNLIQSGSKLLSNDEKLIDAALRQKIPVISEDKKILIQLEKKGISYFNALMMLHFLLFKKKIDTEAHSVYLNRLKRIARYSDYVIEFGEEVYKEVRSLFLRAQKK